MTNEEVLERLKVYFKEDIANLRKKGVIITNPEEAFNNEKIRHKFMDKLKYYNSDEGYQAYIDRELEKANRYARIIGIPEISFSVVGRLPELTGHMTAQELIEKNPARREAWFNLNSEFNGLKKEVELKYLSIKFDEALEQARQIGAHAVMFKRPSWNGFCNSEYQKRFEEMLQQIKDGTYTGDGIYCQEDIGAAAIVVIVKADMSEDKSAFMAAHNGFCLIAGGKYLCLEFI